VLQIQRGRIIDRIRAVYERFGFDPLETPGIERTSVLTGGNADLDKLLYRSFPARGGRWPRREPDQSVSLRFDLTVPLARVVAASPELPKPFKRYQVGNVWRGEKPQLGRFREFLQFDADIVGSSSTLADAEMIQIMDTVMRELGFTAFTIRVNDRKVLSALAVKGGFDDPPERVNDVIRVLDKIDGIGREAVLEELGRPVDPKTGGAGLDGAQVELIGRYLAIDGEPEDVVGALEALLGDVPIGREGVDELRAIASHLAAAGVDRATWRIDPTIARGLDYYTGPVWETVLDDAREIGSVYSGGRYDGLVGRFMTNAVVPCTGTSVGVDRLFAGMELLGMLESPAGTVSQVLVFNLSREMSADYLALAADLRAANVRTAIYMGDDTTFKAQLAYAARLGVPVAVIYGPDERGRGTVQVKDMRAREQVEVPLGECVERVVRVLSKEIESGT
jgi:histidyl-tRNA synthetase